MPNDLPPWTHFAAVRPFDPRGGNEFDPKTGRITPLAADDPRLRRPTCSNPECPLASTLLDPDGPLCGYCRTRRPAPRVQNLHVVPTEEDEDEDFDPTDAQLDASNGFSGTSPEPASDWGDSDDITREAFRS